MIKRAYLKNRFIRGKQLNRMIFVNWGDGLDGNEVRWCDKYLATIEKRKTAAQIAVKRHWQSGGQVLEHGFSGIKSREPGVSPDSLHDADSLAELLVNRAQGFNLDLELVNLGPFPISGSD